MSEDGRKKISFGFSKKSTAPTTNKNLANGRSSSEKIEFIESLEGKEFKTIGEPKEEEKKELVIPLKHSIPKWQRKLLKQKEAEEAQNTGNDSGKPRSLEDQAAQELINDAKSAMEEKDREDKVHSIPLLDEDAEEDKEEPTLDDYEKVPVADFGLAMLRGMGWTPGKGIGKNPKVVTAKEPTIRPRGMGLGAELKPPPSKAQQDDLRLKKGAYVKITQGSLNGCYAQVESFDDECGRVIVRLALGGKTQNVCEYMLQLVTLKEFKDKGKQITTENASIVKRSTEAKEEHKSYGLVKRHRSRSPVRRK